jgi:predicted branched-subunit amino acid permease
MSGSKEETEPDTRPGATPVAQGDEPNESGPPASARGGARRSRLRPLLAGIKDMLPFAPGIAVLGVVFGASATTHAIGSAATIAMSMLVYSGSAQFAALAIWGQPGVVISLSVLALSLRFALMTATIASWLAPTSRWLRALIAFGTTDETFAAAAARREDPTFLAEISAGGRQIDPCYFVGSGLALYVAWVGGTLVGILPGPMGWLANKTEWEQLTSALFAMVFLVLAALTCTTPTRTLVAALGAVLGVVGALVLPPGWHVLVAGIGASLAGPLIERAWPGSALDGRSVPSGGGLGREGGVDRTDPPIRGDAIDGGGTPR